MRAPSIERVLKLRWHRDLIADPDTHAWVLNLYRAGERHPETVDDYFPSGLAPWPWLANALEAHRRDEARHAGLFAAAVRALDREVRDDVRDFDVFNEMIRACTPGGFRAEPGASDARRREVLAGFLAHAHQLELRVTRSLEFHLEACEQLNARTAARVTAAVLRDETRHATYTRAAAYELVSRAKADELFALHRRAEAKANLLFSERQVRTFLARFADRTDRAGRALYRASAALQHLTASHVYPD